MVSQMISPSIVQRIVKFVFLLMKLQMNSAGLPNSTEMSDMVSLAR